MTKVRLKNKGKKVTKKVRHPECKVTKIVTPQVHHPECNEESQKDSSLRSRTQFTAVVPFRKQFIQEDELLEGDISVDDFQPFVNRVQYSASPMAIYHSRVEDVMNDWGRSGNPIPVHHAFAEDLMSDFLIGNSDNPIHDAAPRSYPGFCRTDFTPVRFPESFPQDTPIVTPTVSPLNFFAKKSAENLKDDTVRDNNSLNVNR